MPWMFGKLLDPVVLAATWPSADPISSQMEDDGGNSVGTLCRCAGLGHGDWEDEQRLGRECQGSLGGYVR